MLVYLIVILLKTLLLSDLANCQYNSPEPIDLPTNLTQDHYHNNNNDRARLLRPSLFRPSIFHIVTFPNDECFDASNQSGTCYTSAECKAYGGTGTASCAKGYGTCCIISRSCHNTTSQKVVYFKNPSYPSIDTQPNYCDLTIEVKDTNVCQIRLDLLDLQLDPPTNGECLGDKFSVSATGLATNSIPTLCGLNRNQHLYINLPQGEKERSASLLFMTNSNGGYRWHIRATQIQSPPGCLQYFTTSSGVIESFNFGQYLNNLDYAICIERMSNTCRVSFSSAPGDWSITRSDGVNQHMSGVGDNQCSTDYLLIPGASRTGDGRTFDRYCGGVLNYMEGRENTAPLVTKAYGPIVLRFHSGTGRTFNSIDDFESKSGFRLRFEQSDVNCLSSETLNNEFTDYTNGGIITGINANVQPGNSNGAYFGASNYPITSQKSRQNVRCRSFWHVVMALTVDPNRPKILNRIAISS
uniref:CUB domain-containing protein n=1 Tax=Tetranychus urticae TaxID=32264 RepID=T1K811_TETUR